MVDDTISIMKQNNERLRQKLGRLVQEDEDDLSDYNIIQLATQSKEVNGGRWRHFNDLRDNVEEIRKSQYELPSKDNRAPKEPERVSDRISDTERVSNRVSDTERVPIKQEKNERIPSSKTSPPSPTNILNNKLLEKDNLIASLQQRLHDQELERKDFIGEFQRKEAAMIEQALKNETRLKQLIDETNIRHTREMDAKLQLHIHDLEKRLEHNTQREIDLERTIKSLSLKLLVYKKDMNRLHQRNNQLRDVNSYLTSFQPNSDDTNILLKRDDTNHLLGIDDSSTEYLINGGRMETPSPKSLRIYALAAMFISRVKNQVECRHRVDRKIDEMYSQSSS